MGWFGPRCPVGTFDKVRIEADLRWLIRRVGWSRFRAARTLVPDWSLFPEMSGPPQEKVAGVVRRVARHLGVDPASFRVVVGEPVTMPGAAGLIERGAGRAVIRISSSVLPIPLQFVATVTHELSHLIVGEGRPGDDERAKELLTDLVPSVLGLGVIQANATLLEHATHVGNVELWEAKRVGYLGACEIGYALAVCARLRGEEADWERWLRPDAGKSFRRGLRYLEEGSDTTCTEELVRGAGPDASGTTRAERLRSRWPGERLRALWEMVASPIPDARLIEAARACLFDRDEDVAAAAPSALAAIGSASVAGVVPALLDAVGRGKPRVRAAAAQALALIRAPAEQAVPAIVGLLDRTSGEDDREALFLALEPYGLAAGVAVPLVEADLRRCALRADEGRLTSVYRVLERITPDAAARLAAIVRGLDAEARMQLPDWVREVAVRGPRGSGMRFVSDP